MLSISSLFLNLIGFFLWCVVWPWGDDVVLDFAIYFGTKFRHLYFKEPGSVSIQHIVHFQRGFISGLNCLIELYAALAAKSAEETFYKHTSAEKSWLENRMGKFAQLANSLHSLNLICTR